MIACHLIDSRYLDQIKEEGIVPSIGWNQKFYCKRHRIKLPTTPIIYLCPEDQVDKWAKRLYEKDMCLVCDIPRDKMKFRKNGDLTEYGCWETIPFSSVVNHYRLTSEWHDNPYKIYYTSASKPEEGSISWEIKTTISPS